MRIGSATGVLVAALVLVAATSAKDFGPGDLRLCGAKRCVAVTDPAVLRSLSTFVYGSRRPRRAGTPRLDTPFFELRFRDGYVAGDVGSRRLSRFRSHGVVCGRFRGGVWYHLPVRAAAAVHELTADLPPLRLTRAVPRSC